MLFCSLASEAQGDAEARDNSVVVVLAWPNRTDPPGPSGGRGLGTTYSVRWHETQGKNHQTRREASAHGVGKQCREATRACAWGRQSRMPAHVVATTGNADE